MTNREKAESCGEFVRDGLEELIRPAHEGDPYLWTGFRDARWLLIRGRVVDGARQAGHWGRLALADKVAS